MGQIKRGFTLVILLSFILKGWSQATDLYFSNLDFRNEIASSGTHDIVQDTFGYIWIATESGLYRYDGNTLLTFKKESEVNSLPSNNISCLLSDDNQLWVGSSEGLSVIDLKTLKVQRLNLGSFKVIRCLFKDSKGNIWIGSEDGILIHKPNQGKFSVYNIENSSLSHNTIRCFYESSDGAIWIGTYDRLNKIENGKIVSYDLKGDYKPLIKNNLILDIQPTNSKNDSLLWIGTETGLCLFNRFTGNFKVYNGANSNLSNEVIKCLYVEHNKVWMGTDFGLNVLDLKKNDIQSFYHNPVITYSIANNVISSIFGDQNNILWFATENGISRLNRNPALFKTHEELYTIKGQKAGNQVRDILVTHNAIWLATIHGVVEKSLDGKSRTVYSSENTGNKHLLLDNVYALAEDRLGQIWIGTAGGINIWNKQKQKMYAITANSSNGLRSNYISSFILSNDGTMYVTAWEGGLFRVIGNPEFPDEMRFVSLSRDGGAKIALYNEGVICKMSGRFEFVNSENHEVSEITTLNNSANVKDMYCFKGAKDGNVYLAGYDGVARYNLKTDSLFYKPLKQTSLQGLQSIEVDNEGIIWAATQKSVLRINMDSNQVISMPLDQNSPIKSFINSASTISGSGKIYFGGNNGYIEINPCFTGKSIEKPVVHLSRLTINNQPIMVNDSTHLLSRDMIFTNNITLAAKFNSLSFYFSTFDYWLPSENTFQYKLENFDNDWQFTSGKNNFAVYSNLPPGNYKLKVKGSNYMGIEAKNIVELGLTIKPPLLLSKGFIVLYYMLITGLIYLMFRFFLYRQRMKTELQLTKLEKQYSEEMLQVKQQFFTNISHEFRTPLSLIIPPVQQVLKNGKMDARSRELLVLADKNSRRLLKLVTQILDFRKMERNNLKLNKSAADLVALCKEAFDSFIELAGRLEIEYTFSFSEKSVPTNVDVEKLETVLFNLLSNAFKYTPSGGKIALSIEQDMGAEIPVAVIKVADTGEGIPVEDQKNIFDRFYQVSNPGKHRAGSGIGLSLALEYVKLHLGYIEVNSAPGSGSEFVIKLPIDNSSLPVHDDLKIKEEQTEWLSSSAQIIVADSPIILPVDARKILIIDDNEDILDLITIQFRNQYHLVKARNGQQGLDKVLEHKPDLIISDIMMPVMDGILLCKHLKDNPATATIPVILLTAKSLETHKIEGMNMGADHYITKPFDINYLESCVESVFRREKQLYSYIKTQLMVAPPAERGSENNQDAIFLKKVMCFIERNIGHPDLSVELVSTEMGMSTTHLYRKMKEITQQSPKDIIKKYRLNVAAQMLKNNEGNVTEVMYAIGFSSLSSFSKSFKEQHGLTPSEFVSNNK